jgi:hypothetical protein
MTQVSTKSPEIDQALQCGWIAVVVFRSDNDSTQRLADFDDSLLREPRPD